MNKCSNCGAEIKHNGSYCGSACKQEEQWRKRNKSGVTKAILAVTGVTPEPAVTNSILSRESHKGMVDVGDVLVPGNKDIYQRPDAARYIIDAASTKHELPLLDIQEIESPALRQLSRQYTQLKIGNNSAYRQDNYYDSIGALI